MAANTFDGTNTGLDCALEMMFGAPGDQIEVSSLDHLCITMTPDKVVALLTAAGGQWFRILGRIEKKQYHKATAKDPGADTRLT